METLTKYEEALMRIFWNLKRALVRDVLNELPDPKPPYTTLASNIKLLEKKGFLEHKTYGNILEYFPTISQSDFRKTSFNELVEDYFEGSVENVLSFMVKEKGLSEKDMEELQKLIDNMGNPSKP